jgi:ParB-like chromosome segregation protein Spo0J
MWLRVDCIRAKPLDNSKVRSFAYAMEDGRIFPPIKVAKLHDGTYIVKDGRHRLAALISLGYQEVHVVQL